MGTPQSITEDTLKTLDNSEKLERIRHFIDKNNIAGRGNAFDFLESL